MDENNSSLKRNPAALASLLLTNRLPPDPHVPAQFTLSLTAEERTRSRHYFETSEGQGVHLRLPRGTVLHHGDLLRAEAVGPLVRVEAKPEPVLTVRASYPLALLRAAYHLGNRHVPLEVTETYLRLAPDSVLETLLEQMGLEVIEEVLPFQPEAGAYTDSHSRSHSHGHSHQHIH